MLEVKTGLDLCEISRMEEAADRPHFLGRWLTPSEQSYLDGRGAVRAASIAGLWAAKEAVVKALGVGLSIPLTEIEILHDEAGCPACRLSGKAAELAGDAAISISITHEAGTAAAVCVLVRS